MKRFLIPHELKAGEEFRLSPEETKHALRVLRLAQGSRILLANGKGQEAEAVILDEEKNGARVRIESVVTSGSSARGFRLELLQAPLKGARMDWVVEKATEMGVAALHLVQSKYAVAAADKQDRWKRLAQAAMKQSGCLQAPEIHPSVDFASALSRFRPGEALFLLSPTAELGLAAAVRAALSQKPERVVLAIGPEGGFSPEEEAELARQGFKACLLSHQILRGETAVLAAVAVAAHALDFSDADSPLSSN
jgi:16S rRNA (uracil1498-N3)-methyltransferase